MFSTKLLLRDGSCASFVLCAVLSLVQGHFFHFVPVTLCNGQSTSQILTWVLRGPNDPYNC
jgi:hypothetical protein